MSKQVWSILRGAVWSLRGEKFDWKRTRGLEFFLIPLSLSVDCKHIVSSRVCARKTKSMSGNMF